MLTTGMYNLINILDHICDTLFFLYFYGTLKMVPYVPSVLWRCWLGDRKGIWPVKYWVVGCWHGYLSGARCRCAYGPSAATGTHYLLLH